MVAQGLREHRGQNRRRRTCVVHVRAKCTPVDKGAIDPFPGRLVSDPEPSLPRLVAEVRHAVHLQSRTVWNFIGLIRKWGKQRSLVARFQASDAASFTRNPSCGRSEIHRQGSAETWPVPDCSPRCATISGSKRRATVGTVPASLSYPALIERGESGRHVVLRQPFGMPSQLQKGEADPPLCSGSSQASYGKFAVSK